MIQILARGEYRLIETEHHTKVLILDEKNEYVWVNVENIGEILVITHKTYKKDALLSVGKYRLYDGEDEPEYIDGKHLELQVGCGYWQGYLLPTGLPTEEKKRNRIIPTAELLTKTNNCCYHSLVA